MAEDGKIVYKVKIDDSGVATEAEQAGKTAGTHFSSGAGTMEEVWRGAARRIGEAFVDMAAKAARSAVQLITGSIQTGMEFDAAMSQVAATLGYTRDQLSDTSTQEAQDFQRLTDTALEMGRTTAFTATQAAEALNYMALAGYDADTSISMLPTVLNLAAAGAMDLGKASDAVTDIQSALGLSLEETVALVDQMARTSQKTNTDVAMLAEGMLQVGGAARYIRGGTSELSAILGILASNGIKGAEGGTHLRNMLLRLANPTKEGAAMLEEYGIQIFDAEGRMRSFAELMPDIQRAMSGLTDEEVLTFFGEVFNVRDIASANALMNTSVDEWQRLLGLITDSQGAAEGMASTQLDNLQGDVTILRSAWEGFQIELSNKFTPILREIMPRLIELVGRLTESLINADWSGLGDAIVSIAEIAIDFLDYLINHGDEVIRIVETNGAVLLGGKVAGIARGATGVATGAAKAVGTATPAITGAVSSAMPTLLAASPLGAIFGGLFLGGKMALDMNRETEAAGTIENGTVEEYQQLITDLEARVNGLQEEYNNLANYGGDLTMVSTELRNAETSLAIARSNLATLEGGAEELEDAEERAAEAGEATAEEYAAGLEAGSGSVLAAASSIASGVMSILGGAASAYVEGRTGFDLVGAARTLINVPVMLNSREIARATAWDMGEQMAWEE